MSVVIVNYNTREQLRACLDTISNVDEQDVIVVDNGSTDGSTEMVARDYPLVRLLSNHTNPGYGAGANQGIAACNSEYVLVLNSDTRLGPSSIDSVRNYLDEHPDVAVIGPRLANPDGSLQASCYSFPNVLNMFVQESGLERLITFVPVLRDRYLRTWSHDETRAVPWVLGAALAIRRNAFECASGFDESFFMYYEEVDLCYRLRRAGWEVHFSPTTTITHVGGASTDQHRAKMLVQWFGAVRRFYQLHHSWASWLLLLTIIKCIVFGRLVRDSVRYRAMGDAAKRVAIQEDMTAWKRILRNRREVPVESR